MKKFISAVLLVLVEASVADVDTAEFKLGGYKIQVPLNRPIHVTRVKSADFADLHLPVPRLAELLMSAAHSTAAAAPLSAPPEPWPPQPPPTNRYPDALQQTTYLKSRPPNSLFPSPNPKKHNFPKQHSLSYDPEQHSVSYYEKQHHGAHILKNSFQPPRPDQLHHIAPQYLSTHNRYATFPNVEYRDHLLPNNRYPATEHSVNNKYPIVHSSDRNYPKPYSPHRNPETVAANQHHAPSFSPNDAYLTPGPHQPQPQSNNRPTHSHTHSSHIIDPVLQPQSSRTWSITPRATEQSFPAWLWLPSDPGLAERVTSTEPVVSITEPVITGTVSDVPMTITEQVTSTVEPVTTVAEPLTVEFKSTTESVITIPVPDVPMTTAEHATSTTEPVTTAAEPLTVEFKSTTESLITMPVPDVPMITTEHVTSTTEPLITKAVSDVTMTIAEHYHTSSLKEFIQVHIAVLDPDVVTSATNQVASPFKDFTLETEPVAKVSAQDVTGTAAKRISLPENISLEPLAIMKIVKMTLSEPTAARNDPVSTPVPAVTTNTAVEVSKKEVFSVPEVVILSTKQMTSQTEQFNSVAISAKPKDLIIIATEAEEHQYQKIGTNTSDTIILQTTLPTPSTVTSAFMASEPETPSTPKRIPGTSDPALLLTISVQHIQTTFAAMTTSLTPHSITNLTEPVTEPSTATALISAIDRKNTLKGSVRQGVPAPPLRAARATRAMRATRATPGATTLVPCVRVPRKARSNRKQNRGRKAGPAQRHGGTRAARARALSKRPPRARSVPAVYPPHTRHATATDPPRTST